MILLLDLITYVLNIENKIYKYTQFSANDGIEFGNAYDYIKNTNIPEIKLRKSWI